MVDLTTINSLMEIYLHELPGVVARTSIPTGSEIAAWIDHTLLKPEATAAHIKTLCLEAVEHQFASVCINPVFIPLARKLLSGTSVKVCTVIGFPLGSTLPDAKAYETQSSLQAGADEVDMVVHIGSLKAGNHEHAYEDILGVVEVAKAGDALVKVIIETSSLTKKEKILACLVSKAAGTDFVKTSTGFGAGGATVEDVDLMYRISTPEVKVKASGGIRTLDDALAMIAAGASRIGTSSGVNIVTESKKRTNFS